MEGIPYLDVNEYRTFEVQLQLKHYGQLDYTAFVCQMSWISKHLNRPA